MPEQRRRGVAVRSALPGRERWEIAGLRARPAYASAIERSLSNHAWTRQARANPLTGRLLVVYDRGVAQPEVRDRIEAALNLSGEPVDDMRAWRAVWPHGFTRSAAIAALEQARLRLILSSSLLGGLLVKRLVFGAGMFAGSPPLVALSAVLTILRGYRVLSTALDRVAAAGGVSGQTVISSISLGLLVAHESIDGIAALAIAHAGEYLHARARLDTHAAIEVLDGWFPPDSESPFVRARLGSGDAFPRFSDAALLASGGVLVTTGNVDRAAAMLLGACPVAESESRITARALSLRKAVAAGILFRDPDRVGSLPPCAALVVDGNVVRQIPDAAVHGCGISRVVRLPVRASMESKGETVRELRAEGFAPIVIGGKGKRSAELLAQSDLGIAFAGSSTPDSLRIADVILLEEGTDSVGRALALICRTSSILRQNTWLSQMAGVAGFTVAALGKLPSRDASRLHNYARVAMELNSLRLQHSFS